MSSKNKKINWQKKYLKLKKEFAVLKRKYDKANHVLSTIGSTWPSNLYSKCNKCRVYLNLDENVCSECNGDSNSNDSNVSE